MFSKAKREAKRPKVSTGSDELSTSGLEAQPHLPSYIYFLTPNSFSLAAPSTSSMATSTPGKENSWFNAQINVPNPQNHYFPNKFSGAAMSKNNVRSSVSGKMSERSMRGIESRTSGRTKLENKTMNNLKAKIVSIVNNSSHQSLRSVKRQRLEKTCSGDMSGEEHSKSSLRGLKPKATMTAGSILGDFSTTLTEEHPPKSYSNTSKMAALLKKAVPSLRRTKPRSQSRDRGHDASLRQITIDLSARDHKPWKGYKSSRMVGRKEEEGNIEESRHARHSVASPQELEKITRSNLNEAEPPRPPLPLRSSKEERLEEEEKRLNNNSRLKSRVSSIGSLKRSVQNDFTFDHSFAIDRFDESDVNRTGKESQAPNLFEISHSSVSSVIPGTSAEVSSSREFSRIIRAKDEEIKALQAKVILLQEEIIRLKSR
eukprot:TRINITY_DN6370_c0_g1_i1.p1 TRINITY_DN6370_c0_g1~~TRINITY_DN6370_c0_g1_i1.p1  ORF type:complete len:429 (-),score=79.81 TRINITY_DN6370_c0_g1_i1:51-1337(-)